MLVLGSQRLVVLEVPKTASLALRAMLGPHLLPVLDQAPRHTGIGSFRRDHAAALEAMLGGPVETLAVVREPLRRMESWYRYRLRDQIVASHASTVALSFEDFMQAYLSHDPPPFAQIGRQDRFLGWDGVRTGVDHVFDYDRIEQVAKFLGRRLGQPLRLPRKNRSLEADPGDYRLSDATLARYLESHAAEFDLYRAVRHAAAGSRRRPV